MTYIKHIIIGTYLALISFPTFAQNGVNSPYSRYGFGIMTDRSMGFMRGGEMAHAVHYFAWVNLKGAVISVSIGAVLYLLVMSVGNACGGVLIPLCRGLMKKA